ncbi:MAG: hypothetical protein H0X17_03595 [Deltaproteobacteria bacterium]|nr:hypothetical protein [Deltaproteobacteria bacterium]
MMRTSLSTISLLVVASVLALSGCNKPSEESCKKALSNMRSLIGTDSATATTDLAGDVRRCRGGSSRKAVECAAAATSIDQLKACDFMKVSDRPATPAGSAPTLSDPTTGSAATPAGSMTAPAGSMGAGSATGSGSATATGSRSATATATGSARCRSRR